MSELFLRASREKFRFPSVRGELTTEQLWDLPLTATSGFCLDAVAREVNAELREASEESFVETARNPAKELLEAKLELVKAVIAIKQEENARKREAAARARQREFLKDLLHRKEQDALAGLSTDEIRARLAELAED